MGTKRARKDVYIPFRVEAATARRLAEVARERRTSRSAIIRECIEKEVRGGSK